MPRLSNQVREVVDLFKKLPPQDQDLVAKLTAEVAAAARQASPSTIAKMYEAHGTYAQSAQTGGHIRVVGDRLVVVGTPTLNGGRIVCK
jgi:hypothetical protein